MTVTLQDPLVEAVQAGDRRACARLLTAAERGGPAFAEQHASFAGELGRARRLGITGPPGAGKSSLVAALARRWRAADGRRLGVLAVDPSSPFSGGALLGDRIRMDDLALDPGVFIRSMASRGAFGGLAASTDDLADVFDLSGVHTLLLETVGVGQSEIDVARSTDLTVVVLCPGAGDAIQAMKAGLMEVADVLLVNKADLPGAERLLADVEDALHLCSGEPPRLLSVSAGSGAGLAELAAALDAELDAREADGRLAARRRANLALRVRRLVDAGVQQQLWERDDLAGALERRLDADGACSAHALAAELLSASGLQGGSPS